MKQRNCKDCEWWLMMEEDKKLGNIGECYRYPPLYAENNADFADKRPLTLAMDCCGEFEAAAKPKEPKG